ncbi:MAG: hypothetical protein HQ481_00835 [Alphaproteobacteria bacterium]|nr:hypothetical protein [Alphaproteobacteria bacterium]
MKPLRKEKGPGDVGASTEAHTNKQHPKFKASDSRVQGINAELLDLSRAVIRLNPCHRDPEQYHADKSEIAGRLRSLSRIVAMGGCHGG